MEKRIVDKTGAFCLLVTALIAKLFTPLPRMLGEYAATAAWLVLLLSGVVALIGYWGLSALLQRFPGQSIAQITLQVFGKTVGRMISLFYVVYFIFLCSLMLRAFASGFRVAILPRTPVSVLAAGILLIALYAAAKGFESLSRLGSYLVPLVCIALLLTLAGTIRLMDFRQLAPILGRGAAQTFLLPFPLSSLYSEILALGVLAPVLPSGAVRRLGFYSLVTGILGSTLLIISMGAVFPHPTLSRLFYPILELTRMIEVSEFLQRVEALFIFLWYFIAAFQAALLLRCTASTLREVTETTFDTPFLTAPALLSYTLSFIPVNQIELVWLDWLTVRTWGWVFSFGLPAVTLAVAVVRGKRGEDGGSPQVRAG